MQDLGYKNNNAILNLGSLFIFLILYLFKIIIVIPIMWLLVHFTGYGKKINKWLIKSMFFSELILISIEGSMEFLISGYLNTADQNLDFSNSGEIVSIIVGYCCLILVLVVLPGFFIYLLTRSLQEIRLIKEFKIKWGELYAGCKINSKMALSNYLVFIIRRIIYLYIAFTFTEQTVFVA